RTQPRVTLHATAPAPDPTPRTELDGVYAPVSAGNGKLAFYAAPTLRQEDVADVLSAARRRILRYLERRGILAPVAMPGDGEMGVAGEDALAEKDPLLARL
ncbi:MAG: hypothetical protein ABJA82_08935, partial [Myxococcales bacterium]